MPDPDPTLELVVVPDQLDFLVRKVARDGLDARAGGHPLEVAVPIRVDPATPLPVGVGLTE